MNARDRILRVIVIALALVLLAVAARVGIAWQKPLFAAVIGAFAATLVLSALVPIRWTRRALLLTVTLGFTIGASEIAARLLVGEVVANIYEMDPVFLHRLAPASQKIFRHAPVNGGARIPVAVNADGFRGEELGRDKAARRIVVFGDSCVEAEFSLLENTFPEQLERILGDRTGGKFEAVNAGVIAYGPDQSALRMEADLPRLAPALAVAVIFADNDYGDLIRNRIFSLKDGELHLNDYRIADEQKAEFTRAREMPVLMRLAKRLIDAARAPARTESPEPGTGSMGAWLVQCREEYAAVVRGDRVAADLLEDHYDADLALEPESDSARYKVKLMEKVIARMRSTAAKARVPFVLVILPARLDACDEINRAYIEPGKYPAYDRTRLSGEVGNIAERLQIPYINLWDAYRSRGPEKYYFRGWDDHWNDAGQRLAAELVAELVLSLKLLD